MSPWGRVAAGTLGLETLEGAGAAAVVVVVVVVVGEGCLFDVVQTVTLSLDWAYLSFSPFTNFTPPKPPAKYTTV